jgi:hypothetical protein
MAIFTPGPLAGAISGSVGGAVFSHNRGGPYIRRRPIPVNGAAIPQSDTRAQFVKASQLWGSRTPANQAQWNTWAANNKIPNALGNLIQLSGHQAFVQVCTWRGIAGWDYPTAAPAAARPSPFLTYSMTADIGAGAVTFVFTDTPVGAARHVVIWSAVCDSAGIKYVKNLWKLTTISPLNQASPLDIQLDVEALWGSLTIGQTLWIKAQKLTDPDGLRSVPVIISALVSST